MTSASASHVVIRQLAESPDAFIEELQAHLRLPAGSISEWARNYAPGHLQHYRDVMARVHRILGTDKVDRVLDVGAVPGHLTAMLKRAGLDVCALDIDPSRVGTLFQSLQIPAYQVDLDSEPLPFSDGSFDLILFSEVLEHLRMQPVAVLREVRRVLRSDGHLLLSTPNITPLMRWRFLLGQDFQGDLITESEKVAMLGHMGHFRLYSRVEVERLLSHIGFRTVRTDCGGKITPDRHWDARLLRALFPSLAGNQLYIWARRSD